MEVLNPQELHQLAMTIVGRKLKDDGFEFLSVNSTLKKDPQFVCLKDKKLHFVVVRAVLYPNNPREIGHLLLEKMKVHAQKFNAFLYFAGVGLANAENYHKPILKGKAYAVNFENIIKY